MALASPPSLPESVDESVDVCGDCLSRVVGKQLECTIFTFWSRSILFTELAVLASLRGFVCLIAGVRGFHWGS